MHKKIDGKLYLQKRGLYTSKKSVQATANFIKQHHGYKSVRTIEEDGGYRIYVR